MTELYDEFVNLRKDIADLETEKATILSQKENIRLSDIIGFIEDYKKDLSKVEKAVREHYENLLYEDGRSVLPEGIEPKTGYTWTIPHEKRQHLLIYLAYNHPDLLSFNQNDLNKRLDNVSQIEVDDLGAVRMPTISVTIKRNLGRE